MKPDSALANLEPPPPKPRRATLAGQVLFYVGLGLFALMMVPVGFLALWPLADGSVAGFLLIVAIGTLAACTLTAPVWCAAVVVEWVAKRRASRRRWSWVLIACAPLAGLGGIGLTAIVGGLVQRT